MNAALKNLLRLLCASAAIIVAAAALNFIVDPLQLFRPARLFAAGYSLDNRMQNAGLIRSQEFDTVFMGTSLAVHYRPSDIDRHLGVRSVKLVLPGSTSKEQKFVLDEYVDEAVGHMEKNAEGKMAITKVTLKPKGRLGRASTSNLLRTSNFALASCTRKT